MCEGKIVEWEAYGVHIPLTCVNHPYLLWSTKNIDRIGARTIFFDHFDRVNRVYGECDCPLKDLVPARWMKNRHERNYF